MKYSKYIFETQSQYEDLVGKINVEIETTIVELGNDSNENYIVDILWVNEDNELLRQFSIDNTQVNYIHNFLGLVFK